MRKTKIHKNLEYIYQRSYGKSAPIILLHPEENRRYTDDEIDKLKERDFETRWLICNSSVGGKGVALRTHFTDNHSFESHLQYIHNFVKLASSQNHTAAKNALTELLNMLFHLEPSQYNSFAVTMASGLSNCGENTCFEFGREILSGSEESQTRRKLCLLMDVVFTKVSMYNFLFKEGGKNTYRLIHCGASSSSDEIPIIYAILIFLTQFCLALYVVFGVFESLNSHNIQNLPLAMMTFIYGFMLAYPRLDGAEKAIKLYGTVGLVQILDLFINLFFTYVLLGAGFLVTCLQRSHMEAVIISAVLLFILKIDDHLPKILGMNETAIVKDYLRFQSIAEYDRIIHMYDESIKQQFAKADNQCIGVPFSDYHLTNTAEQATSIGDGVFFQPYYVQGDQIHPLTLITRQSLIGKLEWSYLLSKTNEKCTNPHIGYLKIHLLGSEEVVEIRRQEFDDGVEVSNVVHKLEGVFIITMFQMSNDISTLRVCGSPNARDFLNAMEYYSLWGITTLAKRYLRNEAAKVVTSEKGTPRNYQYFNFKKTRTKKPFVESERSDDIESIDSTILSASDTESGTSDESSRYFAMGSPSLSSGIRQNRSNYVDFSMGSQSFSSGIGQNRSTHMDISF